MISTIENLAIFDFDGTLFKAPDAPPWFTGSKWYTHPASLWPPCLPKNPDKKWWHEKIVHQARRYIQDQSTWCILLTGRLETAVSIRWRIVDLLRLKNLKFDELHFNPGQYTPIFKKRRITQIINRYPQIQTISLWEDNPTYLADYMQFLNRTGLEITAHRVRQVGATPSVICSQETFEQIYGSSHTQVPPHKTALVVFGTADPIHRAKQIAQIAERIKGQINRIIFVGENAADTWLFFQRDHPVLTRVYKNNIRVIPQSRDILSGVRLSLQMIPPDYLVLVAPLQNATPLIVDLYRQAGLSVQRT